MPDLDSKQKTNLWAARVIPTLLLGAFGYVSWVVTYRLVIRYVLNTLRDNGAAIALLVVYYVLLVITLISFGRLLQTILTRPSVIPQYPPPPGTIPVNEQEVAETSINNPCTPTTVAENGKGAKRKRRHASGKQEARLDYRAILEGRVAPPPGLEDFYMREVFVCDQFGLPIWCTVCCNWKPDRTHHCSELGRCVRRMDHFCPWIGGIVCESTHKYFLQCVIHASSYTIFLIIVFAYYIQDYKRRNLGSLDANWAAALGLASFFGLLAMGMTLSTVQMLLQNLTTVENLTRGSKIHLLAIHIDRPGERDPSRAEDPEAYSTESSLAPPYRTITYPIQSQSGTSQEATGTSRDRRHSRHQPPRTFAIVESSPDDHLWDLGPFANWCSVMGYTIWDWLLPLKPPPCSKHEMQDAEFAYGPALDRIKRTAGIPTSAPDDPRSRRSRSRKWKSRKREDGAHETRT